MNEISAENLTGLEKRYRPTVYIFLAQVLAAFILTVLVWLVISTGETAISTEN